MTAVPDWDIVSDADLVGAALSGDRMAFAGIYDRYADRLHDFCVGMVRDRDAAADCVQDVFCTAATALDKLREPDKLRPWLYAIARNEALRRIRQRRREEPSEELPDEASGDAGPDTLAARNELAKLVAEAAGGLSDRDRAVLELGYRHGLEGPELAEALGVSTASAKKIMQRLRDTMERSLGALLVARRGQSGNSCGELGAILAGWDGTFTILMRKRIARHIESCPMCDQDRRRMVNPVALLGGTPLFIPAPTWLRDRTLNRIQLTSASTDLGSAPTEAQTALPDAPTEQFAAADVLDAEPAATSPNGRVMLTMSLLIGIPLIVLALTIAWRYETNAPVAPKGVTTSVTAPPSTTPENPVTTTAAPPPPPSPTAVVTAPPEPTTAAPPRAVPPPQQSPVPVPLPPAAPVVTPQPSPRPLPPHRPRPPVVSEQPSPSQAPPVITEPLPSPTPTTPSGTPKPPRPRPLPPIDVGPIEPAPVTTTQPPVIY
ncbi:MULTISPECIES: sigma-70 family RNA polymerase sigma factor [unclassified Mycobacterium]|uniref:RNA polymerase sigma factor n=1 Tax=unclassified Mycobacterium TaxID=2642494 RepID=UPI00055E0182|nr:MULTISPECIES: sigma-70 family RNA polymerase sigma factor [unclassified Mycobacterium]SEB11400.1 RNA polymerase sigma factor, sigma-70 family [Mycobacterium sp. 283mftsu]